VYEYVNDGVAVDSPLGLLYDNWRILVNSPRRNTEYQSQISEFYKRLKISVMDGMPNAEKFEVILSQRQTTVILHFLSWQRRLFKDWTRAFKKTEHTWLLLQEQN